jgi:poly(3-hydroxybutyrate) depolymerase
MNSSKVPTSTPPEPALIAAVTRQVAAGRNIDSSRIYVAGMPVGGAMAVIRGQEYPDLYAAVGVHSGVPSVPDRSSRTHGSEAQDSRAFTRTSETRDGVPEAELWMAWLFLQ